MKTQICKVDLNNMDYDIINQAATILKKGGLVAFPTETVYGIGANALDINAVKSIYIAKGRPSDNPLIVHISNVKHLQDYVHSVSKKAYLLMDKFWPGPLTLIFKKKDIIPSSITGGLNTVAIRVPSNNIAREIIQASSLPIAAPSANLSGKPSPTLSQHVIEDLSGKVDMIIDGGSVDIGLESTVLDVTGDLPTILRPGGITQSMIEEVIGKVIIDPAIISIKEDLAPKSPGMKYRHYAPKAKLFIIEGNENNVVNEINQRIKTDLADGKKIGVIATEQSKNRYNCDNTLAIGDKRNQNEIALNLFRILRDFDDLCVDIIYSESFSKENIGMATMNRLLKASGNRLIKLD